MTHQPSFNTDAQPVISEASWMEIRQETIAAHEVTALMQADADTVGEDHEEFETEDGAAVSAYASPLALWEMKTERLKAAGAATRKGLWARIKFAVIDNACEERGLETRRPAGVYLHPKRPHMSSRIDLEVSEDGGTTWLPGLAFNVAQKMMDSWRTAVGEWATPEHVFLQCQHHMAVTGAERVYVFALMGGVETRVFVEERDDEMIADIEDAVDSFWDAVKQDRRPPADPARDLATLNRLNSRVMPDSPVADLRGNAEVSALVERQAAKTKQKTALEKEIDQIKAELSEHMEGKSAAILSDTQQLKWIHLEERHVPARTQRASAYLRTSKITDKSTGLTLQDLARMDSEKADD